MKFYCNMLVSILSGDLKGETGKVIDGDVENGFVLLELDNGSKVWEYFENLEEVKAGVSDG